mmetsp:Transcript_105546/g.209730  ORF Transcript_105546/g.209730 Transcript_105546/m.209730 type:complete len:89 (-) Transcript_105546:125-391(-)
MMRILADRWVPFESGVLHLLVDSCDKTVRLLSGRSGVLLLLADRREQTVLLLTGGKLPLLVSGTLHHPSVRRSRRSVPDIMPMRRGTG